jgi:hypothetical protein
MYGWLFVALLACIYLDHLCQACSPEPGSYSHFRQRCTHDQGWLGKRERDLVRLKGTCRSPIHKLTSHLESRWHNGIFRSKVDKRSYVGDELDTQAKDYSGLHYKLPFERVRLRLFTRLASAAHDVNPHAQGILTNWDFEKTVWDRLFSKSVLNVLPALYPVRFVPATRPDPLRARARALGRSGQHVAPHHRAMFEPPECSRVVRSDDF